MKVERRIYCLRSRSTPRGRRTPGLFDSVALFVALVLSGVNRFSASMLTHCFDLEYLSKKIPHSHPLVPSHSTHMAQHTNSHSANKSRILLIRQPSAFLISLNRSTKTKISIRPLIPAQHLRRCRVPLCLPRLLLQFARRTVFPLVIKSVTSGRFFASSSILNQG